MLKMVIFPGVEAPRYERIREAAGEMRVVNAGDAAEALEEIREADAFFGKLTPDLLRAASRLRWVQAPTVSLEHYVFPELVEHPLVLTNMRGLFSDVIADQVMGYVICFARNLHIYIRNQLEGRWAPVGGETERISNATGPAVVTGIDRAHQHLSGMTMGVVGLGHIGGEIARRARAFGMRVLAADLVPKEKPAEVDRLYLMDDLPKLLAESDYVAIAAPHTPRTAGLFSRSVIQRMKPTAYLINIGRGVIVSLDALVAALEAGEIAGAALDVYEQEPLPPSHPLWRFPNVILTPHVAGYSPRIAQRHLEVVLDNVRRFTAGEPLRNIVDKREWF